MLTAVSLMLPYLFGLGCFLFLLSENLKDEIGTYDYSGRLQLVASILALGIGINHSVVLVFSNLKTSLLLGSVLSVVGLLYFLLCIEKHDTPIIPLRWSVLFIGFYLACLLVILMEPIDGWDARSIWFYHGKMIFYNASIDAGGDWSLPSIGFSHVDYPKMIPILAAQAAFVAGYWNEYLPKLSLVALLVPAVLYLVSILGNKWWQIALIAVPLSFTNVWLKNGYMDGYLALYAGLATFFWGRWLNKKNRMDIISGILLTGVVLGLKNEGMLYGAIVATLLSGFALIESSDSKSKDYAKYYQVLPLLLVSISGWLLWERKKKFFGLENDLQLGLSSLQRIWDRLGDGYLLIILKRLYITDNVNLSFGIFLLSLMGILWLGRRPTTAAYFCCLVGVLYFCGIILIYLATPHDLVGFHLPTGDRTMLPVHIILLAAAFSLWGGGNEKPERLS